MSEKEPTMLPADEAALVTTNGMTELEFLMPEFGEDEEVPDLVVMLMAVMLRLQNDPAFVADMHEWLDENRPARDHQSN